MAISCSSRTLVVALLATTLIAGCASTDPYGQRRPPTQAQQGAAAGALGGALTGAALGSLSANAGRGALIGAIGGALAGGVAGNYMDEQRRDFERLLSYEIQQGAIRVERLPGDRLLVSMTNATSFDVDSDQVKPGFFSTLDKIADIVNRYGKTRLDIAGHTDSTGSPDHNMRLSQRRALAVQYHLLRRGVFPQRLTVHGYGQSQPVASNATEWGRALNRRVEITITPVVES